RERGRHRPRGDGVEDRRGAALLPDVARALRGRGLRDGGVRLRRADHEGAAARVRGRDEPPDPAPDGGLGRIVVVERVDFLSIASQDIERSRQFYLEKLGLPLDRDVPTGGFELALAGHKLAPSRTRGEPTSDLLEAANEEEASPTCGDAGNALMLH